VRRVRNWPRLGQALAGRTIWRLYAIGAATAVFAVVGVVASAATAPPGWLTPRDLSEKGADAVIPDVAFDPKGNAVVVWAQAKESSWTIDAVERPPGGPWGAPRALSQPAGHVASPQIAVAGDSVAAVWDWFDGKNLIVQSAARDARTHAWTAPRSLSLAGRDAQSPAIAVDARGDAVAVWASVSLSGWTVLAAYRPAGGAWQAAVPLQPPQAGTGASDVVIDSAGRVVTVWAATAGSGWRVQTACRATDGTWSKASALSGPDATGSIAPQLVLEGTNDAVAVWSRSTAKGSVIEAATTTTGMCAWSQAAQPFTVTHDAIAPSLAVNKRGDGVIVWTSSEPAGLSLMASYRRPGKPWVTPTSLSATGSGALSPHVALDGRGNALAVWTQTQSGFSRVYAASLAAGVWSAPRVLSKAGADAVTPRVALDDSGDGAVAWSRYDGASFVVQGDGYDRSGPSLKKLSIPATGTVGRRLTFSVTAKDVWTTVGPIRWSFGDGSASSARAARHVYARPGRYTARLTVADAFGHVTSIRRVVKIRAR
jgi:PKD domain-containing protein